MILSREHINYYVTTGALSITPFNADAVQPASIDLHLGETALAHKDLPRPPTKRYGRKREVGAFDDMFKPAARDTNGDLLVHRGQFVIVQTAERVKLPTHLAGVMKGKSSFGRIGMLSILGGYVDPGYDGVLTLQLVNLGLYNVTIEPGAAIAQLVLYEVTEGAGEYAGRYQGSDSVRAS